MVQWNYKNDVVWQLIGIVPAGIIILFVLGQKEPLLAGLLIAVLVTMLVAWYKKRKVKK